MILDDPIECPRCGASTKLVDGLKLNGKTVLTLCTPCSDWLCNPPEEKAPRDKQEKRTLLELTLIEFRKLITGVQHAVDKHCPTCSGQGWRALSGAKHVGMRMERCRDCVGTGIDMRALLELWEIDEKPKPARHEKVEGFSPGRDLRRGQKP